MIFKKNQVIPNDVLQVTNKDDEKAIYKFGTDCEVIYNENSVDIYPLVATGEPLIILENCYVDRKQHRVTLHPYVKEDYKSNKDKVSISF